MPSISTGCRTIATTLCALPENRQPVQGNAPAIVAEHRQGRLAKLFAVFENRTAAANERVDHTR